MRIVIYLICIVLLINIAPAAAQKTIIVGGEIDYPPYCFLDEHGRPTGFQVDLTRSIARVMGMEIEINLSTWAEARKGLENGKIDIISGMFYSDERAEIYDFSPPYNIVSSVIFARRDAPSVQSIDDLRDKEIIVMRGEAMHDLLVKQKITQKLILAETPDDVLRRLAAGKGDYALGAQMPGLYWIDKLGLSNIMTMGKPLEPFKNCFSVRKGNTLLLSRFTEGLMILKQTGEYQKLHQKWFGVLETPGVSLKKVFKYAAAVFLPLMVLLVMAFMWSWTLRRTVARRTLELSESRQQIRTLSDNLPDGYVYQILMDGERRRFTYISAGVENLHGVSAREAMADPMLIYGQIIEEDRRLVTEQEALTRESLARFYVEVRYRRPSGEIRLLLITSSPRRLPDQSIAADGLAIDITERKQTSAELNESKALIEAVVENVPLMIFLKEATDLRFIIFNRAGEELLGYDRKDLIGKNNLDLFPPEQAAQFMAKDREVLDGEIGMLDIPEESILTARKGQRLLHTRKVCIKGPDGVTKFLLGISEDITERKLAEDQVKASLKEKEVLLREVHHRVKNNMQVISSLLNMQSRNLTDAKTIEILRASINRIKSMAIIHDKLYQTDDLSRIDARDYIRDLSRGLLSAYSVDPNIDLNIDVDPLLLNIDTVMPLGLIINELVTNSLKYAFPGDRPGRIGIGLKTQDGQRLVLTVSDNGIGIPAGLNHKDTESMGMQLVIALVEQLDGTMELARNNGTEFRIIFRKDQQAL